MTRYWITLVSVMLFVAGTASAAATDRQDEIAILKQQVQDILVRIEYLERDSAPQPIQKAEKPEKAKLAKADWTDTIKLSGDFRYRYQNDDNDTASDERNRQRIRARPAIVAKIPGNVEVGFGMATGSDDPVSTNQTLGGGGSSKDVKLDLAYFDWEAAEGLDIRGGKFKNPIRRVGGNGLLWDGDWRPEGLSVLYDTGQFFGTVLGAWLESDSKRDDEFAYGLQGGVRTELGGAKLTFGAGYYDIGTAGRDCLFEMGECFGNSINPDGTYRYDFTEFEAFAEASFKLGGLPSSAFLNGVRNTDADDFDTGWAAGLKLGKAKKAGSWQIGYIYQDIEADAVLGLVTDSDFAGGGTDSKGHVFKGAYALSDKVQVKMTYFLTERQDSNGLENGGVPYDVDTLQLDLAFKYD